MRILGRQHRDGMAMTVAIIVIIILVSIVGYATTLGFNQKKLLDLSTGKRMIVYYRAQAGAVEAAWRIRENYTTGLLPAGTFADPNYNPAAYSIDVDLNGVNDATIDIGPVNATGRRPIVSTGLDV